MGRREPEFAVEQRKPKAAEGAKENATTEKETPPPEGSWREWLEDPGTMDRMKYFVFAQSFVVFLTMGLPQLQKFYDMVMSFFS